MNNTPLNEGRYHTKQNHGKINDRNEEDYKKKLSLVSIAKQLLCWSFGESMYFINPTLNQARFI